MTGGVRAGQWGEAGRGEANRAGAYVAYRGRCLANCALMMALCEINQTQQCPLSLWAADRGLMWAGREAGVGR